MDFFPDDAAEFDDDNVTRDEDEECEEGEEGAGHDDVAHDDDVAEEDPSISPEEQARPSGTGKGVSLRPPPPGGPWVKPGSVRESRDRNTLASDAAQPFA